MSSENLLITNFHHHEPDVHNAFNKCDLCLAIFRTSLERNQHIFDHFQKIDCSFCQQTLVLIADTWYSPHNHDGHGCGDGDGITKSETIPHDIEEFKLEPVMIPDFVELCTFDHNEDPIDPSEFNTSISNSLEILSGVVEPKHEKDLIDIDIHKVLAETESSRNEFSQINCNVYVESIEPGEKEADRTNNTCPECGKQIKCSTAMKYHLNIHRGIKPYKCATQHCEIAFADRRNLIKHTKQQNHMMPTNATKRSKRSKKKESRSWFCEICNAAFEFETDLIDHTHICQKANDNLPQIESTTEDTNMEANFLTNTNEEPHDGSSQSSEGDELPRRIDVTEMQCNETNADDDSDIKILPDNESTIITHEKRADKKINACKLCDKIFSCQTGLKYHMNLHLGLKPFSCDSCDKSFADKRNLSSHKRTHEPVADISASDYIRMTEHRIKLTKQQLRSLFCPVCKRTFESKKSLQNHMKSHNRTRFMCRLCQKVFRDLVNYKRHQLTHADANGDDGQQSSDINKEVVNIRNYSDVDSSSNFDWICEYCNCDFELEVRLAKHIIKEHNENKLEHLCNICDGKFSNSGALLLHMRAHPESTQHKCTFEGCGQGFAFKSSLGLHLNKHERINSRIERKTQDHLTELAKQHAELKLSNTTNENDSFTCKTCQKTLSTRASLLLHIQTLHTNDRFKCTVAGCEDKVFKSILTVENHIQNFHPETIKKCDICNKSFYSEEKFNEHRLNHSKLGKNSFACYLCDKILTKKHSLRIHLKQHEKDVACNICNEKFFSVRVMMAHRERHGKKTVITCRFKGCNRTFESRREFTAHTSEHPDAEKKKCICNFCGKAFSSLSYLKGHINTHTGERPFKCNYCKKSFFKNGALRRHILIHTGQKPFTCDQAGCNQAYRDSIDLKRHKFSAHNIYTKKHHCPICSKIFSEKKLLTKHTSTVHEKIGGSSTTATE